MSLSAAKEWPRSQRGLQQVGGGALPAVQHIVTRCLAKDPERRFPTMADVRDALQHLTEESADVTPSIAVLPFANLSADPEQEYFSDGLADEIISALAQIHGLKVIARTRHSRISIVLYVLMGWLAVVATKPILELIPVPGILLILAGGIAYTAGLAFFAAHRIRYNHFIWHLFVIAGTICHYFAVLWYAA